ncbi:hypothetical protein DICPUDRAFT_73697 [Dictyostelium purpureum]|uniref:HAT C-terminal dimerisation domain-containing protein n=1 Tax=Dictyostelium purpureum TaxID=5786 RepID=F1A463_DICPU|nr:uncharacterized protein DICPUDRAFT_73697 [Dictyostelium purpureum]EGC29014.1 hypothetical protein DICPUDRAFT_73697 [Dictyostelium purpureum]|eukprot:XP_003294456.1 hypothetical protein DICPUDRAFT_73697 [Dictyostelium purpureum]
MDDKVRNEKFYNSYLIDPFYKGLMFKHPTWNQGWKTAIDTLNQHFSRLPVSYIENHLRSLNLSQSLYQNQNHNQNQNQNQNDKKKSNKSQKESKMEYYSRLFNSELDEFLNRDRLSREDNIKSFWSVNKYIFPIIYLYQYIYMSIPASNITLERYFSDLPDIKTKNRSALKFETIQALLLVRNWFNYGNFHHSTITTILNHLMDNDI